MWRYEQEFRINKPETISEKEKYFDLDNYKDWLEVQLTECRNQLNKRNVMDSFKLKLKEILAKIKETPSWGRWDNGVKFGKEEILEEIIYMINKEK